MKRLALPLVLGLFGRVRLCCRVSQRQALAKSRARQDSRGGESLGAGTAADTEREGVQRQARTTTGELRRLPAAAGAVRVLAGASGSTA